MDRFAIALWPEPVNTNFYKAFELSKGMFGI